MCGHGLVLLGSHRNPVLKKIRLRQALPPKPAPGEVVKSQDGAPRISLGAGKSPVTEKVAPLGGGGH